MAWRPHRHDRWLRWLDRDHYLGLLAELSTHRPAADTLPAATKGKPHMTDQPNVEPPELGITLEQARDNIGRQVEYVAGDLPDKVAFIERGRLTGVPPSQDGANAFVTFDNTAGAKATPLDRLRLLPEYALADLADEVEARYPAPAAEPDGPDEWLLSLVANVLGDYSADPVHPNVAKAVLSTLAKADMLAVIAELWPPGLPEGKSPARYEGMVPPAVPSWPQYQPAPYPMQWGEAPPPWGQPPAPLGEVPDLIEQHELSGSGTPPARFAGERVIYRGRPIDPPLLALVVSVQQSPSGVSAVCQYTVRVPYLGQTLGAFADQLATWHEPEPDF